MLLRYLTHPQVQIDASVPVPEWGLNEIGRHRVASFTEASILAKTTTVVSSAERKAIETAQPIADALGLALQIRALMHENDRSATGYLPPHEFEAMADAFFASPETSVRGWEPAAAAQRRIVEQALDVLASAPPGDILLVGHGGVGTLLYCHFAGLPIDRKYDQPGGGGNVFEVRRDGSQLSPHWLPMEDLS